MFLDRNGNYSAFEEIMHYYNLDFKVYYILAAIVMINCIKGVIAFISTKKGKVLDTYSTLIDIFVSVLAGVGLAYGMFFKECYLMYQRNTLICGAVKCLIYV